MEGNTARPETYIIKMEVDALVQELTPSPDVEARAAGAVERMRALLLTMPLQQRSSSDVHNFATALDCQMKRPLKVHPPSAVSLIGSLAFGTATGENVIADVAVEMPRESFDEKDHLNHRYYVKRAVYLTSVAKHLEQQAGIKICGWGLMNHDSRRPVLLVEMELAAGSLVLRILPYASCGVIAVGKLGPDRNCVRTLRTNASLEGGALLPTPQYNTGIIEDMMMLGLSSQWRAAQELVPGIAPTVRLLKSWARHRGFVDQPDTFNGVLLTMLAVHLVEGGNLTGAMSTAQQFKAVLVVLADVATFRKGIFMRRSVDGTMPPPPPKSVFEMHFGLVFVDGSGWLNLASSLSASALAEAQQAAQLTISALKAVSMIGEASRIIMPLHYSISGAFDYRYKVTLLEDSEGPAGSADERPWAYEEEIERLVSKAAGSRAVLVRAFRRECVPIAPSLGLSSVRAAAIYLGVRVQPSLVLRVIDMGPPADDAAAAKDFLEFWGPKAELRRFPDGRIAEAVVWEAPAGERHLILDSLISFALRRHLPMGTAIDTYAGCLDSVLIEEGADLSDTEYAYRRLDAAASKVSHSLQHCGSMPLKVISVQPLNAISRHMAAFAPQPSVLAGSTGSTGAGAPRAMEAAELLVTLEGSGKWPADETAFRKVKAALGVQLAGALETSFGLSASAAEDHIDVLCDGFAFRLYLFCSRDEVLMAQAVDGAGQLLKQRSSHHALLVTLSTAFPALLSSIRLAQRWVNAHMLGGHITCEAVELLTAAAFMDLSRPTPGSAVTGFISFLQLLISHPWGDRPILVDPECSIDADLRRSLQKQHRHAFQLQALRILTPGYTDCSPSSQRGPSLQILRRLCSIALKSLEMLQGHFADSSDAIAAFQTPLAAFDALLLLRVDALPQAARALQKFPSLDVAHDRKWVPSAAPSSATRAVLQPIPTGFVLRKGVKRLRTEIVINLDPVTHFLRNLEARYTNVAHFFYDSIGGRSIGVKWRRNNHVDEGVILEDAQAQNTGSKHGKSHEIVFAVSAVLADMATIGAGLIDGVQHV